MSRDQLNRYTMKFDLPFCEIIKSIILWAPYPHSFQRLKIMAEVSVTYFTFFPVFSTVVFLHDDNIRIQPSGNLPKFRKDLSGMVSAETAPFSPELSSVTHVTNSHFYGFVWPNIPEWFCNHGFDQIPEKRILVLQPSELSMHHLKRIKVFKKRSCLRLVEKLFHDIIANF